MLTQDQKTELVALTNDLKQFGLIVAQDDIEGVVAVYTDWPSERIVSANDPAELRSKIEGITIGQLLHGQDD